MANYWRRPFIAQLVVSSSCNHNHNHNHNRSLGKVLNSNLTTRFEPSHNHNCTTLGKVLHYSKSNHSTEFQETARRCLFGPCGPWLMLPPTDFQGNKFDNYYSLSDYGFQGSNRKFNLGVPDNARCIASTRGWLGFISHDDLYLSKPHSADQLIQLPSIETLPSVLGVKTNGMGVSEFILSNGYLSPEVMGHFALSSDDPSDKNCILMARQGLTKQLAFCRPGKEEDAWTALDGSELSYGQIVHSEKDQLFYNILANECIEAWDVCDPTSPKRTNFVYKPLLLPLEFDKSEIMLRDQCRTKHYLVIDERSGDLLLVVRYYADHVAEDGTIVDEDLTNTLPYRTQRFDVYEVDFARKRVKYVNCLQDDLALFLGLNHSFVVSTHDFSMLKGNSIYFTDDNTEVIHSEKYPYGGHDLGIFHLEDNSITSCYPFFDESEKIETPLFWVAPSFD